MLIIKKIKYILFIAGVVLICLSSDVRAQPTNDLNEAQKNSLVSSNPDTQAGLNLTIYNAPSAPQNSIAVVKDSRYVSLRPGENTVLFHGVSTGLIPTSSLVRVKYPEKGVRVFEQSFPLKILTEQALLESSLGHDVLVRSTIMNPKNGPGNYKKAKLLSISPSIFVEQEGAVLKVEAADIAFQNDIESFVEVPRLIIRLESEKAIKALIEVSYLTSGLGWKANYIGEVSEDESFMDMNGWVSLQNKGQTDYTKAYIQLGLYNPLDRLEIDQNRILYNLPHPVTLLKGETKQISLFRISNIPLKIHYKLKAMESFSKNMTDQILSGNVEAWAILEHPKDFSEILPEGIIRLYKRGIKDTIEFLGENRLEEKGTNTGLDFRLGLSKHVSFSQVQSDFKQLRSELFESGYSYTFTNKTSSEIEVELQAHFPGEWQILRETQAHEDISDNDIVWRIKIPPTSEKEFRYRVRVSLSDS